MTYYEAVELKNQKFSIPVDKSYVLAYTNFIGNVSDEVRYVFVNTVEMNVSQALFNFVINSGGSINVVCENSVERYAGEVAVPYCSEQGIVVGLTNIDFLSDKQGNVVINAANIFVTADSIQILPVLFTNIFDWCQKYESNCYGFIQPQGYSYRQSGSIAGIPVASENNGVQAVDQGGTGYVQPRYTQPKSVPSKYAQSRRVPQGNPYAQSGKMPKKADRQSAPSENSDYLSKAVSVMKEDFKETFIEDEPSLIKTLADSAKAGYAEGYNEVMDLFGGSGSAVSHKSGGTSRTVNKYNRGITQTAKKAGSMPHNNSQAQSKKAARQSAPSGNNSFSNAMSVVKEDFKETFITDKNEKSLVKTLADSAKAGFKEGYAKTMKFFGES